MVRGFVCTCGITHGEKGRVVVFIVPSRYRTSHQRPFLPFATRELGDEFMLRDLGNPNDFNDVGRSLFVPSNIRVGTTKIKFNLPRSGGNVESSRCESKSPVENHRSRLISLSEKSSPHE